ncbi:MAG: ABC transporter ATP-binding protein [Rhodospirillaceae bacterium]|nr:ABC transporter ATP-binding protein [Rhodospirillaceae bacterium]
MALLEVNGLTKRFGGLTALDQVELAVEAGAVHSIIGPNGAGKSTLLNVLTGSLKPDDGSVRFEGRSLLPLTPFAINQLGIARVFQTPQIFHDLTLHQNVMIAAFAARDGSFRRNLLEHPRHNADVAEAALAALAEVGLEHHAGLVAGHLSRGDKRRLELAICLAHRPKLLLLDEPTAGMSQAETQDTIALLRKLSAKGMTKVVIEHDMNLVFSLSSRITVLHQGRVIADGPPEAIRDNAAVREAYLGGARL